MGYIVGCTWILYFEREEKFLMLKRDQKPSIPYPGKWVFPGGTAEKEETPGECLSREIQEELNYKPDPKDIKKVLILFYPNRKAEEHFYLISLEEMPKFRLNEGERIQWFTLEEIEKLDLGFWAREVLPILRRYINSK